VVQFDSPSDPAMFIHRAGRTARAGKTGHSLVFLTPKEEAYIDFLQRRQVPLLPLPQTEECCPPPDDNDEEQPHAAATLDSDGRRRIRSSADPSQILDDVLPMVRDLALKDRDILEKGTQAFTSFIRAYKEHHCAFIFRYVFNVDKPNLSSVLALYVSVLVCAFIVGPGAEALGRVLKWKTPHVVGALDCVAPE
jgi:ATP-dependent RNA helicase DDX55/SPB4